MLYGTFISSFIAITQMLSYLRAVSKISKEVPLFFYSICNTFSQNCIFQPAGKPNIENMPLDPTKVGSLFGHWV